MNELVNITNNTTMSSIDLLEMINGTRKEFGEPEVENSHFLKRVEDELEGELSIRMTFVNPSGGRPKEYYDLTLEQCTLVGMREPGIVRSEGRNIRKTRWCDYGCLHNSHHR